MLYAFLASPPSAFGAGSDDEGARQREETFSLKKMKSKRV
jgi:hypothetical protein